MDNLGFLPATWSFYEMIQAVYQAPAYHLVFEAVLIMCIVMLFFSQSYTPGKVVLTEKEKDALVEEWMPQPLVPDVPDDHPVLVAMRKNVIKGQAGKYVVYNEKQCLNLGTFNFLNFVGNKDIEEEALRSLRTYGVGSCGPRGFYGTMDVHLKLEETLAKFMNCEECIVYSYGFATIASIIPAYSKRSDVIFCDDGASFAIQKGIEASRSKVCYFRHNDLEHLQELLIQQQNDDIENPKKAKATRRFLIVEGLYVNHGDLCPLPQLVKLKYIYKFRIFLEESFSFGVIGKTGRGVTEHFGINMEDIDLMASSLENSVGTMGGFCVGRKFIIDHQRLSAQGYCFSASQPPMLAAAAIRAVTIMNEQPEMFDDLREKSTMIHGILEDLDGLRVVGNVSTPIKHLQLIEPSEDPDLDLHTLELLVDEARAKGVALTVSRYLHNDEVCIYPPSIRVTVNHSLTRGEIETIRSVLVNSCKTVLASRV